MTSGNGDKFKSRDMTDEGIARKDGSRSRASLAAVCRKREGKDSRSLTHPRPNQEVRDMLDPDMRITFRNRFRFDSRLAPDDVFASGVTGDWEEKAVGEGDVDACSRTGVSAAVAAHAAPGESQGEGRRKKARGSASMFVGA